MEPIVEQAGNLVEEQRRRRLAAENRSVIITCAEGRMLVCGLLTYNGCSLLPHGQKMAKFTLTAEGKSFDVVAFGGRADRISPQDCLNPVLVSARIIKGLWVIDRDVKAAAEAA